MNKQGHGAEQRLVAETFQKSFAAMQDQKIVLYGTGINTEAVLQGTEGFRFVGLMDQAASGQVIYGQKVLNDREVIAMRPMIVIIARQSVVNIIFKRIQYLSLEHGICIYDLYGKLLGEENLQYQNGDLPYWNASEEELMEKIETSEIVSFDIFDTLLMRRTLYPEDVFELVETKLKDEGYECPFTDMRRYAESASEKCPRLDEIYATMRELYGLDKGMLHRMQELECEVDRGLLLRRDRMCRIFRESVKKGKAVYLLSDMYYPGPYMEELLQEHGISGYAGLFVSCDLRKEKSDGSLYQWYLSYVGEGKKLHIGDNRRADVQRAAEYGIDTYHIYSAYELLAASAMQDILADTVSLQKRHILGLMVSKAFNDPFVLGHTGGRLHIRDARQVGFYFVGPLLTEFVVWLGQQMEKMKIRQMLFPSRDGYLVKKIYEIVMDGGVQTVYFRTSRRAASVAGIFDSSDIKRRGARKYNGTYGDWLKQRFGICMEDADPRGNTMMDSSDGEMMEQVLSDYEAAILQNAQEERERYLNYLDEKGILGGEKQAIFDFVAAGTVQHSLERILGRSLQGLYFATMNLPNDMYPEDTEHITAAYGNLTSYGSAASCGMQSGLGQHYLFLESVLVDGSESFSHIDCAGNLVFEKTDTQSGYDKVEKLQEAALEYAAEYRKYFTEPAAGGPEPELTDELFGMLFSGRCIVDRQVREIFKNDDIYDGIRTYRLWEE